MTKPLTTKDYILISAYLDGELSSSRRADVEKRLLVDRDFKITLDELVYTKRLLSAMPQVHARRNFTLTPDKVKKTARPQRFQPVWGAVSAFSTLMLIVVFAFSQFAPKMAAMPSAPMMTSAEDNAVTAEKLASGITPTPMIILWNPQRAYGMGGGGGIGGGDGTTTTIKTGSAEAPLAAAPNPESAPSLSATAEVAPQEEMDPSTLILGLPASDTQGQTIARESQDQSAWLRSLSTSAWLMIISGAAALVAALLAIFTRRR